MGMDGLIDLRVGQAGGCGAVVRGLGRTTGNSGTLEPELFDGAE